MTTLGLGAAVDAVLSDPNLTRALQSAHDSETACRQTRLGATTLARLIAAGLVYVVRVPARVDGVADRLYVHLTARGCAALGIEPGVRR